MGIVKFIKSKNKLGSLQESKTTPDAIYFPTDSTSIIMGGKEYGGQPLTEEQMQAVNSGVTEEWVADVDGQLSGLTSGKADKSDITGMTATIEGTLGKDATITGLSQTNGKVTASVEKIQIAENQVTNLQTDLANKADKTSIPTKVSQLTNDSGFLTQHQDISGKLDKTVFENAIDTSLASKAYIASRGENLVTNGTGLLGNNYNFNSFVFNSDDTYYAGGCFVSEVNGGGTKRLSQEYIAVDVNSTYKLSYMIKAGTEDCHFYDFLDMYDIDKKSIEDLNVMYIPGSTTKLTEDLKDGDTVVHLESVTGFNKTYTEAYRKGLIVWNYKNSYGYQYEPETYSRNVYQNLWSDSETQIDTDNNTITLNSAWNKGTIPAGTSLSQCHKGNTFIYGNEWFTASSESWTRKTASWSGVGKNNASHKFREGTAYLRLGWRLYKGSTNSYVKLSTISLTTNMAIGENVSKADNATALANLYSARPSSMNIIKGDGKAYYFLASSSTTEGKPKTDSCILHLSWDNAGKWDTQLAINSGKTTGLQFRAQNGSGWGDWVTAIDTNNYNTYAPKLDGTGATGSWNITASKAVADEDGNSIKGSYAKKAEINNLDDRLISTVDDAGTYRTRLRGNIDIIETDEILGEIYPPTMTITDDPFEAKADSNIIVATPTEISLKTYSDYGYSSGEDPANETTISSTAISTKEIKADKITKGGRSVLTTNDILGQLGQDDTRVMSQKAVTNALADVQSTFKSITVDYDSAREVYSVLNEQEVIDVMSTNKPFNVHVVTDGNPDVYDTYLASAPSVEDMGNTLKTTAFMADISILGFRFLKIECNVMDISVSFEGAFGSLSV